MIEPPLRALSAVLLFALSSACSDLRNCADDDPNPVAVKLDDDEKRFSDPVAVTYQSAPENDLDPFKAKTKYRFFHELGVTPLFVKINLSFDHFGTNDDGAGSIAESAGNQALIDCKDDQVIEVRNDTCQDFFIQVVAAEAAPPRKDGQTVRCGE